MRYLCACKRTDWSLYISEEKGNKETLPIPGSSVAARPGFPGIPEAEHKTREKTGEMFPHLVFYNPLAI